MNKVLPFVPSTAARMPNFDGRRGRVLVMALRDNCLLQSIMTKVYALPDSTLTEDGELQAVDTEPVEAREEEASPSPSLDAPPATQEHLDESSRASPPRRLWNDIGVRPGVTVGSIVLSGLAPLGVLAVPLNEDGYDLLAWTVACAAVACGTVAVQLWTTLLRRTDSPEPDEDDSGYAAWHYRVRR